MEPPADESSKPYGMETLATLPVFFKLEGRTVVVAGATLPAVWKAELLAAAGAAVRVYDEDPSPEMLELGTRSTSLTIVGRRWSPDDLPGAALALGALDDDCEAARFRDAARGAGIPVNVIDKPEFCDFQFGTILARAPIVIGISTDGAAPVFGQALRARIEAVLPANLGRWASAAKAWRPSVQALDLDFRGRRRFWEAFSRLALAGDEPNAAVRQACLDAVTGEPALMTMGRIILVGSGYGTPDTMTLGAIAALQSADCVVHDDDVEPAAIGLARREAEKRRSDLTPATAALDIARAKTLVWLGTGDPGTCARWRQRRNALSQTSRSPDIVTAPAVCPRCLDGCRFKAMDHAAG